MILFILVLKQKRIKGKEYDDFIKAFVKAITKVYTKVSSSGKILRV